jgi:hypothetical protein
MHLGTADRQYPEVIAHIKIPPGEYTLTEFTGVVEELLQAAEWSGGFIRESSVHMLVTDSELSLSSNLLKELSQTASWGRTCHQVGMSACMSFANTFLWQETQPENACRKVLCSYMLAWNYSYVPARVVIDRVLTCYCARVAESASRVGRGVPFMWYVDADSKDRITLSITAESFYR